MVDVAVKSLSFLVEGARTNWFGFGCPAFCVQPSFSSVLLACLLGFLAGIAVTVWAFWTFHSFGFSLSGPVPAPPSSRYSVLAEYLNEHSSQSRRRRSWPHLGDLRISISGPASQATDLLRSITSGQLGASSAASSAASVAPSFDLVSQPPASHRPPRGYPERLEHRDTILATFRPCPDYLLEGSSKLVGSKLCGADRVRRAYLAGQWAKAVRDKRVPSPNRTPPIELKNRFYAILSGGIGLDRPILFSTLRPRTGPPLGTVCQIPQLSATVSRARQRLAPIWQEQTSSSLTSSHDDGADGWSGSHSGRFGNGVGYHGALRAHFSARWRFGWDHRDLRFGGYEASRGPACCSLGCHSSTSFGSWRVRCGRWYLRSFYGGLSTGSGTGQWYYGCDRGGGGSGVGRLHPRCHPPSITSGAFCRGRLWIQRSGASSTTISRSSFGRSFALGVIRYRKGEFLQCRVRGRGSFPKAEEAKEASESLEEESLHLQEEMVNGRSGQLLQQCQRRWSTSCWQSPSWRPWLPHHGRLPNHPLDFWDPWWLRTSRRQSWSSRRRREEKNFQTKPTWQGPSLPRAMPLQLWFLK